MKKIWLKIEMILKYTIKSFSSIFKLDEKANLFISFQLNPTLNSSHCILWTNLKKIKTNFEFFEHIPLHDIIFWIPKLS